MENFPTERRINHDEWTSHLFVMFCDWHPLDAGSVVLRRCPFRAFWARPHRPFTCRTHRTCAGRPGSLPRRERIYSNSEAICLSTGPKLRGYISCLVRCGRLPAGTPYGARLLGRDLYRRANRIAGCLDFGFISSLSHVEGATARSCRL